MEIHRYTAFINTITSTLAFSKSCTSGVRSIITDLQKKHHTATNNICTQLYSLVLRLHFLSLTSYPGLPPRLYLAADFSPRLRDKVGMGGLGMRLPLLCILTKKNKKKQQKRLGSRAREQGYTSSYIYIFKN